MQAIHAAVRFPLAAPLAALFLMLALVVLVSPPASAQSAAAPAGEAQPVAPDPELEARVQDLSHKLRCLVCQNQSIAESNAPLAVDLRNQVREQLAAGKDETEVVDYLVARYGDFVLYLPPFKSATVLLWLGPALLLVGCAGWLALRLRRRAREAAPHLSPEEHARARALLEGTGLPPGQASPRAQDNTDHPAQGSARDVSLEASRGNAGEASRRRPDPGRDAAGGVLEEPRS